MMGLNSSLWFDSQGRATGKLRNTYFRIRPINLPQRIADFAYSCVSANSIDDEWHGVRGRDTPIRLSPRLLGSGSLQRVETALHFVSGTAISKKFQFSRLLPRDALIDIKSIRRFFFYCELVHADDDLLFGFDGALILIRCLSDFFLRISALDGFDHAAHCVELAEIVQGTALHLKR